jgi:hypothetical protein
MRFRIGTLRGNNKKQTNQLCIKRHDFQRVETKIFKQDTLVYKRMCLMDPEPYNLNLYMNEQLKGLT